MDEQTIEMEKRIMTTMEGSEEMVDVPLGLFLDCVHLIQGTAENYRVPVELVKAMRMALYKMGNYNAEMKAGELYRLIEWKEKSDGNS